MCDRVIFYCSIYFSFVFKVVCHVCVCHPKSYAVISNKLTPLPQNFWKIKKKILGAGRWHEPNIFLINCQSIFKFMSLILVTLIDLFSMYVSTVF